MTRGGGKRPPKKKHSTKPRKEPVNPLSDSERATLADEAEEKAAIHLQEAEALAEWGKAPNACLHSAYYAMHFCATAALYRAGGVGKSRDVPKSHEHVIEHYIKLAETRQGYIQTSGELLNRARDDRMRADYFIGATGKFDESMRGANPEEAAESAMVARNFINAWKAEWGSGV